MVRTIRHVIVALVLTLSGWNAHVQAKEPVDLLLVLAADVSRSVDADKFKLQREGYAAAFSDARVISAITSGLHGRIAVCFVEWSEAGSQRLVIDWALIKDLAAAKQFGDQLLEIPRSFADSTSISGGIDFALTQFRRAPFDAERRTIDVSGISCALARASEPQRPPHPRFAIRSDMDSDRYRMPARRSATSRSTLRGQPSQLPKYASSASHAPVTQAQPAYTARGNGFTLTQMGNCSLNPAETRRFGGSHSGVV
jgi:hypothetical protein